MSTTLNDVDEILQLAGDLIVVCVRAKKNTAANRFIMADDPEISTVDETAIAGAAHELNQRAHRGRTF